jgi:hypothetical protein
MEQPYGAPMYPLTTEQVVDIYRMYNRGVMSPELIERSIDIVLKLDSHSSLKELFEICTNPLRAEGVARKMAAHA